MTWTERAACRPGDPGDWLLPDKYHQRRVSQPVLDKIARLKAICSGCPVKCECLADALATPGEVAVRGGTTLEERWPLGQKRMPVGRGSVVAVRENAAQCGTTAAYFMHRRRGEDACRACKDAIAAYQRRRAAALRAALR